MSEEKTVSRRYEVSEKTHLLLEQQAKKEGRAVIKQASYIIEQAVREDK